MAEASWWQRWTNGKTVTIAFVAYLAFSIPFFMVGPYGDVEAAGGIVDDDFGASPSEVQAAVEALQEAQADYRSFLAGDMVYALLQGVWLAGFLWLGARQWRALPNWSVALPLAATLFDWTENICFLILTSSSSMGVATVAVGAMHLKLVTIVASLLLAAAVLGYWITHPVQRLPRRPRQPRQARKPAQGAPGSDGRGHGRRAPSKTRGR